MPYRFAVGSIFAVLAAASLASASTFELSGTVLEESGVTLVGATVTLLDEGTGRSFTAVTNDSGHYAFAAIAPGEYTLEASADGFATSRFAGLRYFADTKPIFNVRLRLRAVQESMTFTGEAPLINVSQSQLGLSLEEKQLSELPLRRRSYLELVDVEGGAHELSESAPGAPVVGAPLQTVNGAGASYTSYQLDGFGNTRDQHGVVHMDVDVDAVEEFRVISGQFSAEYGRSLTGIVSATTQSGEADFRGSAFFYLRPGSWDADDPLTGASTSLDRQEIGFTLSGPVRSERTQFFASYSYRNQDDTVVVTSPFDGARFSGLFELPSSRNRLLVKLSHLLSDDHHLTVKALFSERDSVEGVGGYEIFDNRLDTLNEDVALVGTLVSDLGKWSNELRFGVSSERFRTTGHAPPLGAVEIHPTLGRIGNPTRLERADEAHVDLSDTLTVSEGNHSLKTGFAFRHIDSTSELQRHDDGTLFFAPDSPESPILFWQTTPESTFAPALDRSENHVQLFVQDDWQLTPYVSLNLGLRWERESSVPDNNNVAPRLGVHWDATGDGRTAVRAGYGVFYSFVFSIVDALERLYGVDGRRVAALEGGVGSPDSQPTNFFLDAPIWADGERQAPRAQHFTLGFERELMPTLSVAFDVTHVRGSSLIVPVDLNAPQFFDYTNGGRRTSSEADATRPFGAPGRPIAPGERPELPDGYPFDGYRDLYLMSSRGESRFWGMKLNITKRYAQDTMLQAIYNWSRTENDGDDFRVTESLPLDPARSGLEWGRSATDIPHSFVLNGVWDAPLGFRVTGLFRARSGRPVDPRVDDDLDGDLKLRERGVDGGTILERNSFRAPATATLDLSVGKIWELEEGRSVQAAVDVFNLLNRLNPRQYLQTYGALAGAPLSTFLDVVQAAPPRQIQLSVRFSF